MRMSIAEAVKEKLVYIGMTQNLHDHIDSRIPHACAECPPCDDCNLGRKDCMLNNAEKEALAQRKRLMVSWAELGSRDSAFLHKAELLRVYKAIHGRLPGIMGRNGKWVRGNKVLYKKTGQVGDLNWHDWLPMDDRSTADLAPEGPGVQRVRAE